MFVHDPLDGRRRAGRVGGGARGRGRAAPAARRTGARPAAGRRRRPAPGGPAGPAGPDARLLRGLLRPLVAGVGERRRCCGPSRSPATPTSASAFVALIDPVRYPRERPATRRTSGRSAGSRRGSRPSGCRAAPTRQRHTKLGPRRPGRRRVDGAAAAAAARRSRCPALRTTRTLDALRAAQDAGLVDAEQALTSWRTPGAPPAGCATRRCWCAADPATTCPNDLRELTGVARVLGYPPGAAGRLVDDYRRATRRARTVVEQVFYR